MSHWLHWNRKFPILFRISSCPDHMDMRYKASHLSVTQIVKLKSEMFNVTETRSSWQTSYFCQFAWKRDMPMNRKKRGLELHLKTLDLIQTKDSYGNWNWWQWQISWYGTVTHLSSLLLYAAFQHHCLSLCWIESSYWGFWTRFECLSSHFIPLALLSWVWLLDHLKVKVETKFKKNDWALQIRAEWRGSYFFPQEAPVCLGLFRRCNHRQ